MRLTRRGFIGGIVAALVTRKLPKPNPAAARRSALSDFIGSARVVDHPPTQWSQTVYGTPIMYAPASRVLIVDSLEETLQNTTLRISTTDGTELYRKS